MNREENFHAVFARITGPRDRQLHPVVIKIPDLVAFGQGLVRSEDRLKQFDNSRPLDREAAKIRAPVFQGTVIAEMFLQPGEIFIGARRVYDQKKSFRSRPVNNQVIDDATALIEEKRVLATADFQFVDIVGQHLIQPGAHARPRRNQLAHMGNIEDAGVLPDGLMLVHDAGVLDRHDPIAKRDHLRAEPHMLIVERSLLQGCLTHGVLSLDAATCVSTHRRLKRARLPLPWWQR